MINITSYGFETRNNAKNTVFAMLKHVWLVLLDMGEKKSENRYFFEKSY